MSENYDIVERLWTTANVKINIIKLSAEVISEKLSILSDGSGTITSGEYDLFILNNSVVNVPSIFKVLDQHSEDNDKVAVMAKEIRSIILEVNPLFDPELLVISTENRIKIPDQKDKPGDVRALTANPMWGKVKVDREDDAPSFGDFFPVGFSTMGKRFMSNDKFVTHVIEELDRTIDIIEHNPDSIPEIFKDKFTFEPDEKYSAEIKYKMYVLPSVWTTLPDCSLTWIKKALQNILVRKNL
jgi:hypothetical protein